MAGSLSESLDLVVSELRLGAEAAGCDAFTEFIGDLSQALATPGAILEAESLLPVLQRALAAQTRTDYVELADLLQYELRPRIGD